MGDRVAAGEGIRALALSPGGDLAFATESRVVWSVADNDGIDAEVSAESAVFSGVNDLAFDGQGRLWLGTDGGLFVWKDGDRPVRKSLPGSQAERGILRIAAKGQAVIVTTTTGAYWSSGGSSFQHLSDGTLGKPISLAVMRGEHAALRDAAVDLWLYGERGLTRISGRIAAAGVRITASRAIDLPRPRSESEAVGLVLDSTGAELLMAYADALAHRAIPGAVGASPALVREGPWQIARPSLGVGNAIRDVAWTQEGVVLATKGGLFEGDEISGPFQRARTSVLPGACTRLKRTSGGDLIAACRSGLWRRRQVSRPSPRLEAALGSAMSDVGLVMDTPTRINESAEPFEDLQPWLEPDPPVAEIRRRAIEGAGLSRARAAMLRKSLWRRGFWPDVSVGLEADFDRDDRRLADQSFVSGDYRFLSDRTSDLHSGYRATLDFEWQLGETVYPEDAVDLSREQRQVTSLRDDVTDEIHQLYFERQRIRVRLRAGPPFEAGEPNSLRLRAAELAAGLDAWTDGWLSEWRRARTAAARSTRLD